LAKIENDQFQSKEALQLDVLIKEKIQHFEEAIAEKELLINAELATQTIHCNKEMMDILVGNLLNNAIRYNYQHGNIGINISANQLTVSNTSRITQLDEGLLFQRFYRHTETKQDGNGLGLSIVKQICDVEGLKLLYEHAHQKHFFKVQF
jgi:signal transduction histidine kinase